MFGREWDGVQRRRLSPTVPDMWRRAGRAQGGKPADGEACLSDVYLGEERGVGKQRRGRPVFVSSCNDCNGRSKMESGCHSGRRVGGRWWWGGGGGVADAAAPMYALHMDAFAWLCESLGARLGELPVTFRGSATMSPCFPCSLSISALHNTHSLRRAGVCVAATHSRVQESRTCICLGNKMRETGGGGCADSSGDGRASLTIRTDWLKSIVSSKPP